MQIKTIRGDINVPVTHDRIKLKMYGISENMWSGVGDARFPSVYSEYVLLPLVNRDAVLAYCRAE